MKKKNRIGTVFIYLIFIVLCLAILYPFLCVLSVSLSSAEDIKHYGFRVIPKHLDFSAYSYLFRDSKMLWQAYGTTIFVSVVGTAIGCLCDFAHDLPLARCAVTVRDVYDVFQRRHGGAVHHICQAAESEEFHLGTDPAGRVFRDEHDHHACLL